VGIDSKERGVSRETEASTKTEQNLDDDILTGLVKNTIVVYIINYLLYRLILFREVQR
jgi:hypothetical protein